MVPSPSTSSGRAPSHGSSPPTRSFDIGAITSPSGKASRSSVAQQDGSDHSNVNGSASFSDISRHANGSGASGGLHTQHADAQDDEAEMQASRSRPTMSISSILNDSKGTASSPPPTRRDGYAADEAGASFASHGPLRGHPDTNQGMTEIGSSPPRKHKDSKGRRSESSKALHSTSSDAHAVVGAADRSSLSISDLLGGPSTAQEEQSDTPQSAPAKKSRGGRPRGSGRGGRGAGLSGRRSTNQSSAAANGSGMDTDDAPRVDLNGEATGFPAEPLVFEEPSEENAYLWQAELDAYKLRTQFREKAIEEADEAYCVQQHYAVHSRLGRGYELRLNAIVRKAEQRALMQRRQEQEVLHLQQEATRRRKERELDQELLSTLGDSSLSKGKGKGKAKGKAKAGASATAVPEADAMASATATPPAEPTANGKTKGVGRGKGRGKTKTAANADTGASSPAPFPPADDDNIDADETQNEDEDMSVLAEGPPAASTPSRKGKGKKRKLDELQQQAAVSGATPTPGTETPVKQEADESIAVPMSTDALLPLDAEIDPDGPPLPMDDKRVRQLEDAHRRLWVVMARKEIPKVHRIMQATVSARSTFTKRVAAVVQREARRGQARMGKQSKDVQQRSRKAMREMLVFWRRNEKEEKELRRKADKEAADRLRKEEEMRETKRQARKLNFLITQTELYSHFVGNKLRTNEAEESEETSGGSSKLIDPSAASSDAPASVPPVQTQPSSLDGSEGANSDLKDIDFDDEDESNMRAHAARNAREAVAAAKSKAQAFDAKAAEDRRKAEEAAAAADREGRTIDEKDLGKAFDSDDMNFQNPTSMGQMDVTQPKMLTCQLKEYQLKGLNWLANLYEQGINGILADEMGLGKTVQSISLMSYLAEVHDIWGPFLVIAPSSTLHNWQQEITKFTPALKALPYWGSVKDRNVLRKFWNKKHMQYNRDSPFHVLITSYQLVVTDEKYFKRLKWQYMILDEAQAIKSSQSTRWKTLLSFNCRNRLLLTGTPVQNSMQELWALLHFIMPSLFDSHDEFSEWFSKDIEGHAENKGTLNEGQLRRLHMILKPFMLRRVKKNVQNELGDKIEIDVMCEMSARQKMLYRGLRENVSIAELMDRASNLQDEAGLKHLMNLVMQFRKVCNHPELFERADVSAPVVFGDFAQTASLSREGDMLYCPDSVRNRIEFAVPKTLVRQGGLRHVPGEQTRAGFETKYLDNLMNIWRESHIATSLKEDDSAFAPLRLLNLNGQDAEMAFHGHTAQRTIKALEREQRMSLFDPFMDDSDFAASALRPRGRVRSSRVPAKVDGSTSEVPSLHSITDTYSENSPLANPDSRLWTTKVVAPAIQMYSDDRPFVDDQERLHRDQLVSNMLYGGPPPGCEDPQLLQRLQVPLPGLPPRGVLGNSTPDQLPAAQMQVPQINKLIIDSSKLAHLDRLLRELKANDHRVLIYFQMTKMIDLMEEYLIYRQYKYLRLDGSSKISERRDMVTDWQTKPELFVFLLSTRAGGLGINLTAADTVIFFDSDWNPSNDQQAMDRAHRLGQTKQVTVYRLITRGTIDERIIKMARNKKEVQDMVVGNKTYNEAGMAKPQEIVSLLMDDDELADAMLKKRQAEEAAVRSGKLDNLQLAQRKKKLKAAAAAERSSPALAGTNDGRLNGSAAGPSWSLEDDEDDFFGAKPAAPPKIEEISSSNGSGGGGSKKKKKANAAAAGTPKKKATAVSTPGGGESKKRPRSSLATTSTVAGDADADADATAEADESMVSMSGSATPGTSAPSSKKKQKTSAGTSAAKGKRSPVKGKAGSGEVDAAEGDGAGKSFTDLETAMLDE